MTQFMTQFMAQFNYNLADLTPEQLAAINDAIANYNKALDERREIEAGVAERYYECQDD